jgi:hypothetical protein
MKILPKPEAFAREAIILIGGAVLAALVLRQFPKLREFIDNGKPGGCNCGG